MPLTINFPCTGRREMYGNLGKCAIQMNDESHNTWMDSGPPELSAPTNTGHTCLILKIVDVSKMWRTVG